MKILSYALLTFTILFNQLTLAQVSKKSEADSLYASELIPIGRYLFNDQKELELISSAVHFGVEFKGNKCEFFLSAKDVTDHNYIQYEVDGLYKKRVRIEGKDKTPLVIKTEGNGKHRIWIYKATEAHSGAIIINRIVARHIKPITPNKRAMIEFIGNSITCGALADNSELACGLGDYKDHHNAYMAYGPRVARNLGVNYMLSSVSGIGVYRTWNRDDPSMPQVYENIDFQVNTKLKWNFNTYSPKVVSIALGTNDLSNGDGKNPRKPFEEAVFISNYVNFIQLIKSKYPHAQIVLLSSPMVKGTNREVLEKCLRIIKEQVNTIFASGKPIQTFFLGPIEIHGCNGHPSVEDHLAIARQLMPVFKKLLAN